MKYRENDIVVDINERLIYRWKKGRTKLIHRTRLATPGETKLFLQNFPSRKEISYSEFKEVMPVFDGRRLHNEVYGYIPLSESQFIFLRDMNLNLKFLPTNEDKISILINNYLEHSKHNKKEDKEDLKKLRKIASNLREAFKLLQ